MRHWRWMLHWYWMRYSEKAWVWIANHVPRELALRCAIRVAAHATTGKWGTQTVPALTLDKMLSRWDKPNDA